MSTDQDRAVRNQVMEMLRWGHVGMAEELCRDHLGRRSRDHEAMAMLAQILFRTQRIKEARRILAKALARDAKRPDYQALMGEILAHLGKHREAIDRYNRALKIQDRYEGAIAGKAETLLRMGEPERAIDFLDGRSLPVDDHPMLAIVKAKALVRLKQHESAVELVNRHLPGDRLAPEHRRSLHFIGADAAAGIGDFRSAATRYEDANAVVPGSWETGSARARRLGAEAVFSADAMSTLPSSECADESPVFIVGMPRTGSTLTEQIIDAHPRAAGLGELDEMPMIASRLFETVGDEEGRLDGLRDAAPAVLGHAAEAYLDAIRRLAPKADRRVDKQLGNVGLLGLIALLFPKARVVHCRRHPMDAGLSCWTRKFAPGTNGWAGTLEGIAAFQRECDAWMAHWKEALPLPILDVRYESLVHDLEGEARRIIDFCGLEWDDRCLRFWETGRTVLTLSADQVRRPLYTHAAGRHADWGTALDPLREGLGDAIDEYAGALRDPSD